MTPDRLQSALRSAHRLQRTADLLSAVIQGMLLLVAALLATAAIDAALGLTAAGLLALDGVLLATAVFVLHRIGASILRSRFEPRRVARLIERRMSWPDNRLINAVQLANAPPALIASPALARLAVARGDSAACSIIASSIVDHRPLLRRALRLAGLLAVVALIHLTLPSFWATIGSRLMYPSTNRAPFTLARFEFEIEPRAIHVGDAAVIRSRVWHPWRTFARADLRMLDADSILPMAGGADGRFALSIDRVDRSRRFHIVADGLRSPDQTLNVLPIPQFRSVHLRIEHPTYTGWPDTEQRLDDSDITVLAGAKLTFTAESNMPLASGRLTLDNAQMAMKPLESDATRVSASFTARQGGPYRIMLVAADATPSRETLQGALSVLPDQAPIAQLLAPDLRVVAPEGWSVPLRVALQDDVAVVKATLHQWIDSQPPRSAELPLVHRHDRQRQHAEASATIDLAALGARAGQTVRGFVTALDNHPDPPHSADSTGLEILVVTLREYQDLARQEYRTEQLLADIQATHEQLNQLDQARRELMDAASRPSPDEKEIARLLKAYEQQARELAQQLAERAAQPPIYDFEQPYQQTLARIADQLKEQAARAGRLSPAADAASIDQLKRQLEADRQAAGQWDQLQDQTEQEMRRLAAADALSQEGESIMRLAEDQKRLAERLTPYQDAVSLSPEDRARAAQLAADQRLLQKALDQALLRLDQAAGRSQASLPKMSRSARDLVGDIRRANVIDDQQAAAQAADSADGPEAHRRARQAAEKLASFTQSCGGMCDNAGDDLDGLFGLNSSQLQTALSQLQAGRSGGQGQRGGVGSGLVGSGGGRSGARPTLLGPRSTGPNRLHSSSIHSGDKLGSFNRLDSTGSTLDAPRAERLNPDASPIPPASVRAATQTPAHYRALTEQYFRRLATETHR